MDLLTKRCGCGRILKQRESCPVCAERRRAEMHVRGVAVSEPLTRMSLMVFPEIPVANCVVRAEASKFEERRRAFVDANRYSTRPPAPAAADQEASWGWAEWRERKPPTREAMIVDWQHDRSTDEVMVKLEDGELLTFPGSTVRRIHAKRTSRISGLVAVLGLLDGAWLLIGLKGP